MDEETNVIEPAVEEAPVQPTTEAPIEGAADVEAAPQEEIPEPETPAAAPKAKEKPWYVRKMDEKDALIARQEKLLEAALALAQKGNSEHKEPTTAVDPGPQRDQFNSDEDYYGARFRWEVRNEAAQAAREEAQKVAAGTVAQTQAELARTAYIGRVEEFTKDVPDFEEVVGSATDVQLPEHIEGVIITSPKGPQIAYELATMNRQEPETLRALLRLPPALQMLELGQRLAMKTIKVEAPTPKPTPVPVSKAPAPIIPVAPRTVTGPTLDTAQTIAQIRAVMRAGA